MIKYPYCKSKGSLFWIRQPEGEKIHLPGVQMDLIWRNGKDTTATIKGALPDNVNLFRFRDGDAIYILYKDCGAPDEFDEDQIVLLLAGCRILQFEARRLLDQSDDPMTFELVIAGEMLESRL